MMLIIVLHKHTKHFRQLSEQQKRALTQSGQVRDALSKDGGEKAEKQSRAAHSDKL